MLRDATEADREAVRIWRNHPQVRRSSITTHEIGPDEHLRWWRAVERDPGRRILIFEWAGVPAGVVTFAELDPTAATATWGFYLDIAGLTERGELLPAWLALEKEAISYGFDTLGLSSLGGETLEWNTPVIQLHKRFGFTVTRTYPTMIDGANQTVVWTELSVADRR